MSSVQRLATYEAVYEAFRWDIPARYNIAADVCDRHAADENKIALIGEDAAGKPWRMSFRHVQRQANRLANLLVSLGLRRGDRVMLLMVQDPWVAIGHVACWKAGLVSLPCSVLFGPDAVAYRLAHADVRVVITDCANLAKVTEARRSAASMERVFLIDGDGGGQAAALDKALEPARDAFTNVDTASDDPAFFNFTSGTTGNPKGALQAHRSMLGHLPGIELPLEFFPQPGDVMWSPADWAWLAGLMDVLMPAWYHGVPVLTSRAMRFEPEAACALMARHGVRTALLTPTALRMMRQVKDPQGMGVRLRAVVSGGEAVGKELHEWAGATLGTTINEAFGQTECNLVLGNCASIMPVKPGSLGRSMPGHVCAIVDDQGRELPPGEIGNIAVRRPDPVMMLEYWKNPKATRDKYVGHWLITGDLGTRDADGYFWFQGRADDIISSSGYRIGPTEIEDALTRHPAVMLAAAVGVPDPVRTESIKAFLVLRKEFQASAVLAEEIRGFVRERLAKHEVPREIEFLDALPMTTTGKVLRRELREAEKKKVQKGPGA